MTSYTKLSGLKPRIYSYSTWIVLLLLFVSQSAFSQIVLTKSTDVLTVGSGDCIDYELFIECSDLFNPCENVEVVDTISPYLSFSSSTPGTVSYTYDPSTGEIVWTIGQMSAGSNVSIAYSVCLEPGVIEDNVIIENEAIATDESSTSISSASDVTVNTTLSWEVSKSVTSGPIYHDTPVNYEIQVCNNAGSVGTQNLSDATLADELPAGAVFLSADNGGMYNGMTNMIEWDLGLLDVTLLGCRTFEISLIYPSTDVVNNDTGFNPGTPLPKDNTAILMGTPPAGPANPNPQGFMTSGTAIGPLLPPTFSLSGSKSARDEGILVFDSTSVFDLDMENTGTSTLVDVTVSDVLPAQVNLLEINTGGCSSISPTIADVMYTISFDYAAKFGQTATAGNMILGPFDASVSTNSDITSLIDTSLVYVSNFEVVYDSIPSGYTCSVSILVTDGLIPDMASSTGYFDNSGTEYDFCDPFQNCSGLDGQSTMGFPGVDVADVTSCDNMAIVPQAGRMDPRKSVAVDYINPPAGGSTTGNPYFQGSRVRFCVTFENDGPDEGVSSFSVLEDVLGTDILPEYLTFDDGDPATPAWWIASDNTNTHAIGSMGLGISFTNEANTPMTDETRLTWRFSQDFEIGDEVEICFYATIDNDAPDGSILTNNFCMNSNTQIFCDDNAFGKPNNHSSLDSHDPMDYVPAMDIANMENIDICCKSTTFTVMDSTAVPDVSKAVISSGPYLPTGNTNIPANGTDTIEYQITLSNNSMANVVMPNPEVYDLLSDQVTYVPGSFRITNNTTGLTFDESGGNPSFSLDESFVGDQDLAQWAFAGDFPIGSSVVYTFKVVINAGEGGTVSNTVFAFTPDENQACLASTTDVNDLNQNMNTSELLCESTSADINILSTASISSSKWVRGPEDTEWIRFPEVAKTFPDDTLEFRMLLTNVGNIGFDRLSIVDILPFVGDVGVRTGQPRTTEWRPFLEGPIAVPMGCNIFYTTEDEPCRDTYPIDVNDMGGPAGCNPAAWVEASMISDWSTIQAFYITCESTTFDPADTMEIIWTMRAPIDAPPGIACNSFAYRADRLDNGNTFKAEPIVACIELEIDTIGDYVWLDANADGIQDVSEDPIEGITMALFDTLGNLLATTDTDVNGFYKFSSIIDADESWIGSPGIDKFVHPFTPYYVVAAYDLGSGSGVNNGDTLSIFPTFDLYLSPQDQGSDLFDSDGALANGSDPVFLQGLIYDSVFTDIPARDYTHDFGFFPGAELGDYVWFDANLNGQQDPIESGIQGITVYLLDENMNRIIDPSSSNPVSQVTDINGFYSFEEIIVDADSDTFFVEFALNDIMGSIPTPIQDSVINIGGAIDSETDSDLSFVPFGDGYKTDTIIVLPGDSIASIDAGVIGQDTIGDFVFEDVNGNGIQDPMDMPLPGVKVYLILNGEIVDSTLTDGNGDYTFPGLIFGPDYTYKTMFVSPLGYVPTLFNDPFMIGDEGSESDANPTMMLMTETYNFTDPSTSYLDLDAGFVRPVAVGDTVWIDENANGIQDGEPPLAGVTVTLYRINPSSMMGEEVSVDAFGNPVMPITTDMDGRYIFEDLFPGNYYVEFDVSTAALGSDYVATLENQGIGQLSPIDSDLSAGGESDTAFVASGGINLTLDAGYFIPVSVGDTVFVDANGNGLQDAGELGIPGVGVDLYKIEGMTGVLQSTDYNGADISNVTTNADGFYFFEDLAPGVYYVEFDISTATDGSAADYVATFENVNSSSLSPNDSDVNGLGVSDTTNFILSGGADVSLDAGYFVPVSVGDTVFVDNNGNGIQDLGELGLEGVSVSLFKVEGMSGVLQLTDYNGIDITTVQTNADGYYKFEDLAPGQYYVEFDVSSATNGDEYYSTFENINGTSNDPIDSDINSAGLSDTTLVLASSEMDCTLDAGYFLPVSVGDTAFVDVNLNGLQDPMDPPFEGVEVTLFHFDPRVGDFVAVSSDLNGDPVTPIFTDQNGSYLFDSLPPGTYYVNFDAGDVLPTIQDVNNNMDDEDDSDIDAMGNSDTLLVLSGVNDLSFDAGYEGIDFGDLPEEYITSEGANPDIAPRHVMQADIFLGNLVDHDAGGSPSNDGLGDDLTGSTYILPNGAGGDDEDGIEFLSPLIPGNIAYVKITYSAAASAFVNAFMDFDGDMVLDPIEFVSIDGSAITPSNDLPVSSSSGGMIVAAFNVPDGSTFRDGLAYSRFRLSTAGGLASTGLALDGEVEDYVMPVGKIGNLVWLDENFDGQQNLSDPEEVLANVPVVLSYNFTRDAISFEVNDTLLTDANGLYSFCGLLSSNEGIYQITVLTPEGLAGTMENEGDDISDSDNSIEFGEEGRDSVQTDPFMITDVSNLPTAEAGQGDDPNSINGFPDAQFDQSYDFGFVPIDFGDLPEMDFGDLPIRYQTTEDGNHNPARHIVTSNKRLGSCIDSEPDGQPDEMGLGDDDNMDDTDEEFSFGDCTGGSDEDGIEFLTPMIPGDSAYIKVTYTLPPAADGSNVAGFLNGWIDFNGNGRFQPADRVRAFSVDGVELNNNRRNIRLQAGTDTMVVIGFLVPENATFNGGMAFTRFRLSCEGGLGANGVLPDGSIPEGEVEDYVIPLGKVGNLVWLDQDYDGIQDTLDSFEEEGIEDVEVLITYTYVDAVNDIDLTIIDTMFTDEDGKYGFCGLIESDLGEYKLTVIAPESFTPTVSNNLSEGDILDSDHTMNQGDTLVMTDVFQITDLQLFPRGEDGLNDEPNEVGTFADSLVDQSFDFGFVPLDYGDLDSTTFATVKGDNGAIHVISETKFLGAGVDAEIEAAADTIAGATVDGDDNTGSGFSLPSGTTVLDDEDGIQFITPLIPGFKATIEVTYNLDEEDGFLNGWIDFNGNGVLDAEEALVFYTDAQAPSTDGFLPMGSSQTIELCFDVPADAVYNEGDVHARFRLSCDGGLDPSGGFPSPAIDGPQAPQGEVEDYYLPLGKIGNLAFFDNDLDGSQDGNVGVNPEIGIEGVNNTLIFAGFASSGFEDGDEIEYPVTTDANGNYYVCGLIPGEYDLLPNKYVEDAITPEDTIPVRYVLTAANCDSDDDLDSDFIPSYTFTIPDLLANDLVLGEDGFTDDPGNVGFPDEQDQVNIDQGWIPEPNIEAIANIAGVDYPTSGQCRQFNVIADVCIQNTGFVEMNGELIGARLENIDIDIDLGEQFMGAFVGVIGDPIILDTVEYEEAFMLIDDDDTPSENPDFDGLGDIDGSLVDGIIEPSEIVCLRIMFEIAPDELSDVDAMNLSFNAVVSGMAINEDGKELPDYFNGGQQYVAVDSSDRVFMFDGTYDDPDEPEPLTNCYETTKDLSVQSLVNLSFDESCMALITPQMMLTQMDMSCDNDDYPLGGYYRLQLEDLNGNVIIPYTDSLLLDDPAYIGNMYNVAVQTVSESCNSAWGKVTIENKFPPTIECANDTITCGELLVLDPPTVLNNCGEINLTLLDRTTVDVACEDPNLQLVITETWIAIDPNGLRSDTCTQTLSVEKFDINEVEGPAITDTILNCSIGTMPSPESLGVPSLNGVPLYPDNFAECGIFVDFEDEYFSFGNDCSSGVQRTWIVQNWICGSDNSTTFTQLITFVDTTGPELTNIPSDLTISTSGFDCTAIVEVPAIGASDDCNPDDIRVDINYEGGFQMNSNGASIELPVGTSSVTYIVYDVCGNTSTASYNVTVRDQQQPVTICDAFTVVSLNSEGLASLSAEKLDNGSMDECGPVDLAISRMDDNLGFLEEVDFTCADIGGGNIMVALRVTDISGNANTCMAEVELQDKVPPVLVSGLPDITISCTFPFDMDNLSVFGTVVNDPDSIEAIIIDDTAVQFSGPAQDALIVDNCSTAEMSEITSGDLDNCGNGTLVRTIIATSPNGEQITFSQNITLVNPTPFLESDITWPDDITLTQCTDAGLNPINFPEGQGFPLYEEDNCDMVSSTYEDRILSNTPNGGGCLLIERTWYVSDWCQRENDLFVIFEEVQLITVINEVAPTITSSCEDIRVESIDAECGDVFVNLTASATDDCVMEENLIWEYEIDAFSDGSVDFEGSGNDASGSYPVGIHQIRFLVGDGCGNVSECSYSFELVNTKPATPLCFQGLSAGLTPMDTIGDSDPDAELFMLTPDFIDAGSFHSCGYDLQLSFSADVNDTLRIFGCEDLGQQAIQLWVTDPTGNQDFCATFIIVEDNNDVDICPPTNELIDVTGSLYTEEQVVLSEMEVFISKTDTKSVSDENGVYSFLDMPMGGDYTIEPTMDLDHKNGVTTLDLIMIQKHILGVTPITSPYKLLAADVNRNGQVTGSDILELRKLILGLYDRFPSNTSWRFVDAAYDFIDPSNPWSQAIPETYDIYNLSNDMEIDFYGLKVGDINGSVEVEGQPLRAESRSNEGPFTMKYDDVFIGKGETVFVPIYGDRSSEIAGYQFTMEVDKSKASLEAVESLNKGISDLNFGERFFDLGYLTSSWNQLQDEAVDPSEALFGIRVRAKEDLFLSEVLSLSNEITRSEAYSEKGNLVEVELALRENAEATKGQVVLNQNQPNPWTKNSVISFSFPEATDATIRIFDVTGKLIKVHRAAYEAGLHEYEVIEQDFASRGVYYYELITDEFKQSKKMVLIK